MTEENQGNQIKEEEEEEFEDDDDTPVKPIIFSDDDSLKIVVVVKDDKNDENDENDQDTFNLRKILNHTINPTTEASLRIQKDLEKYQIEKKKGRLPFTAEIIGGDLFTWRIKVTSFNPETQLYKDINKLKKKYIEFQVLVPENYPYAPPFIWCVQPRFKFHTGHITVNGSICNEVLSKGWNCSFTIPSLMIQILADFYEGKPKIDFTNLQPYSIEGAKADYIRVAKHHGWLEEEEKEE